MGKGVRGFEPGNRCGLKSRFSSEKQPANRGRKKTMYKNAMKLTDNLISKQDFVAVIRYLWEQPLSEINRIKKEAEQPGSDVPSWVYAFICAMLSEIKRGKTDLFRYSMDFVFGKQSEKAEIKSEIHLVNNSFSVALGRLSDNDLIKIDALISEFNRLLVKCGGNNYLIDLGSFMDRSER